jgi:hypothetical protein
MPTVVRTCLLVLSVAWAGSAAPAQTGDEDPPPTSVAAWKMAHFTPEELRDGTSGDLHISGHDGIPNLLRCALGLPPREPIEALVTVESAGDQVIVRYRNADPTTDIACRLEVSGDLEDWNPVVEASATSRPAAATAYSLLLLDGIAADEPRFFRLAAERLTRDADGDALDDDAELAWFATVAHGPADDPDQDGISTADELTMGRSPHHGIIPDPTLALRTTGLEIFTPLD